MIRSGRGISVAIIVLALAGAFLPARPARADDDPNNEYRITLYAYHPIATNLTGFFRLGYFDDPDKQKQTYEFGWPNVNFQAFRHVQLWGGLYTYYRDYEQSANTLELRPYGGVKLFLPNHLHWNIYNFTRYEYRSTEDLDTHEWTGVHRLRSRFGLEVPLARGERAWQPHTWYLLHEVEPYYRFDTDQLDPLDVRVGVAYVLSDRVRVEFIYTAGFSRPNGGGLAYTDNQFRLNFKIGLKRGLLGLLHNPDSGE
jgi:hypothetical protein